MTTYADIAANWDLWCEYVNPSGSDSHEDWKARSVKENIERIELCFGLESDFDVE